tara:strand:+ start:419 stop:1108 length:690 start_codon:yes stop_codon:yes gene_type:complete
MIIELSNKSVEWNFPEDYKYIVMKISGGLDSAICFYMLCKYIREERKDLSVIPMTHNDWKKPYQVKWSKKIIEWMKKEFPDVTIHEHETSQLEHGMDYIKGQVRDKRAILKRLHSEGRPASVTIHGQTMMPDAKVQEDWLNGDWTGPNSDDGRDKIQDPWKPEWNMFRPIINLNKKEVAELYQKFNLQDTLFNQTRSCENPSAEITQNFETHCGECWWCKEREWGFGKI